MSVDDRRKMERTPKPEKVKGATSVRFTPEEHAEVVQVAKEMGITIGELIRFTWGWASKREDFNKALHQAREVTGKARLRIPQ